MLNLCIFTYSSCIMHHFYLCVFQCVHTYYTNVLYKLIYFFNTHLTLYKAYKVSQMYKIDKHYIYPCISLSSDMKSSGVCIFVILLHKPVEGLCCQSKYIQSLFMVFLYLCLHICSPFAKK